MPRQPLEDKLKALSFQNVTAAILSDVSVTAGAGRRIAIIGPNGAGKSTLLSLAAGLEQPEEGKVLLGDRPTVGLTASERRRTIALVWTWSPILAGSLRRALAMGVDGRPDDETIAARARAFGLDGVLDRLGGLDGKVLEAGRNLSAVEIRRVLLTRAALSKPEMLLLDEPDDALDHDGPRLGEQLVSGSGATVLAIIHNLSIARHMDEIWVVENRKIVTIGKPEEVLASLTTE